MANVYVSLPVPLTDGVGAWVDVSTLAPTKTLSVDGGPFDGKILIECSNDNRTSASPADVLPFVADQELAVDLLSTYQFMRARRVNSGVNPGTPTVKVGAELATSNIFGAMNVPAGDGVGTPFVLTSGGAINTFTVVGAAALGAQEVFLIEGSTDAGVSWSPILRFDSGSGISQTFQGVLAAARVRRRGSAGAAAPLVAVGSGGDVGGGTPTGTGTLQFDSIRVVGTQLESFVTTGFQKGTFAYVGNDAFPAQNSVHRNYQLVYGEALAITAAGTDVVNSPTFGVDGAQWVSLDTINQQALQKLFWTVNFLTGNDENTGWGTTQIQADSRPLKTVVELRRRLTGWNQQTAPVFHYVQVLDGGGSGVGIFTQLDIKGDGNAFPGVLGDLLVIDGGSTDRTITAIQAAVPATNTERTITIAGLGVVPQYVGMMVQRTDGGKTAYVTRQLGANVLEISEPRTAGIGGSLGVVTDFVNGEHVNFRDATTIPDYPFTPSSLAFSNLARVRVSIAGTGLFTDGQIGTTQPFMSQFFLGSAVPVAQAINYKLSGGLDGFVFGFVSTRGILINCKWQLFSCALQALNGNGSAWPGNQLTVSGELNLSVGVAGGFVVLSEQPQAPTRIFVTDSASIACFGVSTAFFLERADPAGNNGTGAGAIEMRPGARWYGQNNTLFAAVLGTGQQSRIPTAGGGITVTSAAPVLAIAGTSYAWVDLPINSPFDGATVSI